MEDAEREEGMSSNLTWVDDLEWTKVTASIKEGATAGVVGAGIKGEPGIRKLK